MLMWFALVLFICRLVALEAGRWGVSSTALAIGAIVAHVARCGDDLHVLLAHGARDPIKVHLCVYMCVCSYMYTVSLRRLAHGARDPIKCPP